ncbi:MAG TPA: hypothetical protein VMH86_10980 [Rhizomicrobium sp.]|nr:hypothetical protein [Rhizomicrobium sp.]
MYEVFDAFLAMDTWHTSHSLDDQRFYRALDTVVRDPDFNADDLRRYLREKLNIARDDHTGHFSKAVDLRAMQAWAVRDFLAANDLAVVS